MSTDDEGDLRQGAERLLEDLRRIHNPVEQTEHVLQVLRMVKLVAYQEMLIAAKFHAGPHGDRIDGMVAGIERAIDSQRHEL